MTEETKPEKKRQPPKEIPFADTFKIRYTTCLTTVKDHGVERAVNEITMYFYNEELTRSIGEKIRIRYPLVKHERQKSRRKKKQDPEYLPDMRVPPVQEMERAVIKLIEANHEMALTHTKKHTKDYMSKKNCGAANTLQVVTLNKSNFAVFWLCNFDVISDKYWRDAQERKKNQKMMAHLMLCLGERDLSSLLLEDEKLEACFSDIRKTIDQMLGSGTSDRLNIRILQESIKSEQKEFRKNSVKEYRKNIVTRRMREYALVLWRVMQQYLTSDLTPCKLSKSEIAHIRNSYYLEFKLQHSVARGIRANLAAKSLSRKEYGALYSALVKDDVASDVNKALLMMLFMGLSAAEVCALKREDIKPLEGYKTYLRALVTKEYKVVDLKSKKKRYYLSDDFQEEARYRSVPVPLVITKLLQLKKMKKGQGENSLFSDKAGKPLLPEDVEKAVKKLFPSNGESIFVVSGRSPKTMQLAFQSKDYQKSLSHLWCLFGLQDGEIRYLLGHPQVETAAKHYIDFNNPHKQYSMGLQMSYAMSNVIAAQIVEQEQGGVLFFQKEPEDGGKAAQHKKQAQTKAVFDHTLHTRLHILQSAKIALSSNHGMSIEKIGEKVE